MIYGHTNGSNINGFPNFLIHLHAFSRPREDEENDGDDGDGIRDEDGGYDACCHRWSLPPCGQSSNSI